MDNSSSELHCVFVETNIDTRLAVLLGDNELISMFKEKICNDHRQCFPEIGEVTISALKVKRDGTFYHLSDSTNLSKVFEGYGDDRLIYVTVEKKVASSNLDDVLLPEKKMEVTNDPNPEERSLKTEVVEEKKTKKMKMKSSRRKSEKIPPKENVEVAAETEIVEDSESSEKEGVSIGEKEGVSIGEDKETGDVEMLAHEELVERVTIE